MGDVFVESYDPLTQHMALRITQRFKENGFRVELRTSLSDKVEGGDFWSLKVLIVEPVDSFVLRKMLDIADEFKRPVRFNESDGFRIG